MVASLVGGYELTDVVIAAVQLQYDCTPYVRPIKVASSLGPLWHVPRVILRRLRRNPTRTF